MEDEWAELTQKYSTWGDKLLGHTDVLYSIQKKREFKPITVQLAPCETCDSSCSFCSVGERPLTSKMPYSQIEQVLGDFRELGAKSLEITGGGNPLLYRDGDRDINDIISLGGRLGYDIGIITNSHSLTRLDPEVYDYLNWVRVSLIQLDEGIEPEQYDFNGFPPERLGFSYIIYDEGKATGTFAKTDRYYKGTDRESIEKIARLVDINPDVKFVRIAGNCLIKGNNKAVSEKYKGVIDAVDEHNKFFVKDIWDNDGPYNDGCYVGLVRPYVAPHPDGGNYQVYMCTSHVLNERNYDMEYSLGPASAVKNIWKKANERFKRTGIPYEVKNNGGKEWCDSCNYCYYSNNNKLLHTVANELPDANFP